MESIVLAAQAVLRTHPAPALRLSELTRLVAARSRVGSPASSRLRWALESRPDLFRVLDPWRGPWRSLPTDARPASVGEPWVVAVSDPGNGDGLASLSGLSLLLRATVRWQGLGVDASSLQALARWHEVALSEGETRSVLLAA